MKPGTAPGRPRAVPLLNPAAATPSFVACERRASRRTGVSAMKVIQPRQLPAPLQAVLMLAGLLERLECSAEPVSAPQYRTVVQRLAQALQQVPADRLLQAVLDAHPAAAELYENLNYRHAGLCRSPLEPALQAELQARDAIARVAGPAPAAPQD